MNHFTMPKFNISGQKPPQSSFICTFTCYLPGVVQQEWSNGITPQVDHQSPDPDGPRLIAIDPKSPPNLHTSRIGTDFSSVRVPLLISQIETISFTKWKNIVNGGGGLYVRLKPLLQSISVRPGPTLLSMIILSSLLPVFLLVNTSRLPAQNVENDY
jgi:hypothetical protein